MTGTITFQYDEVRLARWMERRVDEAGIEVALGASSPASNPVHAVDLGALQRQLVDNLERRDADI